MHADVLDEVGFFAESLDAVRAFERPGERVRFDVIGQEAETPEALAAVRTLIGTLARVCAHVVPQKTLETKLLVALGTRVSFLLLCRVGFRRYSRLLFGDCDSRRTALSVDDGLHGWRSFYDGNVNHLLPYDLNRIWRQDW